MGRQHLEKIKQKKLIRHGEPQTTKQIGLNLSQPSGKLGSQNSPLEESRLLWSRNGLALVVLPCSVGGMDCVGGVCPPPEQKPRMIPKALQRKVVNSLHSVQEQSPS